MTSLPVDLVIIGWASLSFTAFIVLQLIVLRMVHPDAVLRWIVNCFLIVSAAQLIALAAVFYSFNLKFPGGLPLTALMSYGLFGLIAFVYIVCVFGPSETSIRIRLVRELHEVKGCRMTHKELLAKYNGRMILERRLQRLVLAGEIAERQGKYVLLGKANAFFVIDLVAGLIQKILNQKPR